ncbi:MAG TPA: phage holin family protein [Trichocoleus sp.]|jgi:putative membrane protein
MVGFLIVCLVNAVSLWLISKLPLGVEIDSAWKALISGLVIGLLNIFVRPLITILGIPVIILTLGLFYLLIPVIIFGLAAWLIEGFRLRNGILSAILGAIALGLINSILFWLLNTTGLVAI